MIVSLRSKTSKLSVAAPEVSGTHCVFTVLKPVRPWEPEVENPSAAVTSVEVTKVDARRVSCASWVMVPEGLVTSARKMSSTCCVGNSLVMKL